MIQDIAPAHLSNEYDPDAHPAPDDLVFCFDASGLLVSRDGALSLPRARELAEAHVSAPYAYLFSLAGKRYFLARPETLQVEPIELDGYRRCNLREIRGKKLPQDGWALAAYTAYHLWNWYDTTRFCGKCGAVMGPDDVERAMRCPLCGNVVYPRINPAVIVGVVDGDRILLSRYARGRGVTFNALIAGFTEIGETLEQTVAREVMEEVGLHVKNLRYYKSQPWGISSDILAGYYCDVDGDSTLHVDHSELARAAWVARDDIELQPDDLSLTNEMMLNFKVGGPLGNPVAEQVLSRKQFLHA